jgi:hypothetical protein
MASLPKNILLQASIHLQIMHKTNIINTSGDIKAENADHIFCLFEATVPTMYHPL